MGRARVAKVKKRFGKHRVMKKALRITATHIHLSIHLSIYLYISISIYVYRYRYIAGFEKDKQIFVSRMFNVDALEFQLFSFLFSFCASVS